MDRRQFLGSLGVASLGGCVSCELPAGRMVAQPLSDAHAHFFNASDLPVAGFLKDVIIPARFRGYPSFADGLVDLVGWAAKRFSVHAATELRRLNDGTLFGESIDPREFGREVAAIKPPMEKLRLANACFDTFLRAIIGHADSPDLSYAVRLSGALG